MSTDQKYKEKGWNMMTWVFIITGLAMGGLLIVGGYGLIVDSNIFIGSLAGYTWIICGCVVAIYPIYMKIKQEIWP